MSAHYEVFKDKAGEWRWTLRAKNGEPVSQSEAYRTKRAAQVGSVAAWLASIETARSPAIQYRKAVKVRRVNR